MGYMVGYEPYATGYLIWYPGNRRVEKARDVIFHEDAIAPALPTLYGENDAPRNVSESSETKTTKNVPSKPPPTPPAPAAQPRLFIRIPARPAREAHGPEDQSATIEEIPPEQSEQDQSRLISNIPDFPQGSTRSGRQRGEMHCLLVSEDAEDAIVMAANIMGEPQNIYDALNLPGDEGEAWEHAHQAEWQNMIDHDVFGPPERPPPSAKPHGASLTICVHTGRQMPTLTYMSL
jgi:hypothetical protein